MKEFNDLLKDLEFIDIGYNSTVGKILNYLQPYDLLDINHAEISHNFKERANLLDNFENIKIYTLSREDIIASKIDRYEEKDRKDIQTLMDNADLDMIDLCIKDTFKSISNPHRRKRYLNHFNRNYGLRIAVNDSVQYGKGKQH